MKKIVSWLLMWHVSECAFETIKFDDKINYCSSINLLSALLSDSSVHYEYEFLCWKMVHQKH